MKRASLICFLALALQFPAAAQLAGLFYNITAIEKEVLPNAIRITIRADGVLRLGADRNDFMDLAAWAPKPVRSVRLRFLGARPRLPALVEIGAYPVEAAATTLARDEMVSPYYGFSSNAWEPRMDVELRFFVPVIVRRFMVDRYSGDSGNEWNQQYGIDFGRLLGPLEVGIELGADRRSVVITAIPDRNDLQGGQKLKRLPPELAVPELVVEPRPAATLAEPARLRILARHIAPADLVAAVDHYWQSGLEVQPEAARRPVTMVLPAATRDSFLATLARTRGLVTARRTPAAGGHEVLGDAGDLMATRRLPLRYLRAERARELFPDFLLPAIRVDTEQNALLVNAPEPILNHLEKQLSRLDVPSARLEIEASAWEVNSEAEALRALQYSWSEHGTRIGFDTTTGTVSVLRQERLPSGWSARLQALETLGRARLRARQRLQVQSGEEGNLFAGQSRYVIVLQNVGGQQSAQAVQLQLGVSLRVRPIAGSHGQLLLNLTPRYSTLDAVEAGTGLPTIGVRELGTVVSTRSGDLVVISGLEMQAADERRQGFFFTGATPFERRQSGSRSSLLLLVQAREILG